MIISIERIPWKRKQGVEPQAPHSEAPLDHRRKHQSIHQTQNEWHAQRRGPHGLAAYKIIKIISFYTKPHCKNKGKKKHRKLQIVFIASCPRLNSPTKHRRRRSTNRTPKNLKTALQIEMAYSNTNKVPLPMDDTDIPADSVLFHSIPLCFDQTERTESEWEHPQISQNTARTHKKTAGSRG